MHSITLLCTTLVLHALSVLTVRAAPLDESPRPQCRCLPDQACWPSPSTWSALNDTVGGHLIATTPVARECHDPYYDQAKCDQIRANYFDPAWRQNQPGAVEMTNWETLKGQGCLGFNRSQPCFQGSVPLYSVQASEPAHVQAAVRFAAKHNIRLVIKNSGHCFLGRSTAQNSLNVWTHSMNDIAVVDSYVPQGAPEGTSGTPAVVMGGGVLLKDMFQAVHDHGRVAVGGAFGSVSSIGGYCQGGGHSPISRYHGLCVDNVLQYKVVTADGELVVANAYQNQDLFWALRGGGGGTFGVVVEGVVKTHPAFQNISHARIIITADEPTMTHLLRQYYAENIRLDKEGWSGYNFIERQKLDINYHLPNASLDQAKASFKPFLDTIRSLPGVTFEKETFENYPSYLAVSPRFEDQMVVGGTTIYMAGRLIPQSLHQTPEDVDRLVTALQNLQTDLQEFSPNGTYMAMLIAGGAVTNGSAAETSLTPAWRDALMLTIPFLSWSDDTPYERQLQAQETMTRANKHLIDLIPQGGTYTNEADPNEPNWQQSFFGDNYLRLRDIKSKYDPNSLFVCRQCVGSEDWDNDLMCRNRS